MTEPVPRSLRAQVPVGSSYIFDVVRPDCEWRAELYKGNVALCFRWNLTHAPAESQAGKLASHRGCQSMACGALFEGSRGTDMFVDFDEAVKFDDALPLS